MNWLELSVQQFEYFILLLVRVSGFILAAPIIGSGAIPTQTKIGLSFLISLTLFPIMQNVFPPIPPDVYLFGILIIKETMIGILVGLVGLMVFSGIQLSGQIFGMQMGFGIVNVIDPLSHEQISLLGQFLFMFSAIIFLAINGHHLFIEAIYKSYDVLPIGGFNFSGRTALQLIMQFNKLFLIGVKIGFPVTASLLLTTAALALIARTIPQMNIFIVGLPIQIIIGLTVLGFSLIIISSFLRGTFYEMLRDIIFLLRSLKYAS